MSALRLDWREHRMREGKRGGGEDENTGGGDGDVGATVITYSIEKEGSS